MKTTGNLSWDLFYFLFSPSLPCSCILHTPVYICKNTVHSNNFILESVSVDRTTTHSPSSTRLYIKNHGENRGRPSHGSAGTTHTRGDTYKAVRGANPRTTQARAAQAELTDAEHCSDISVRIFKHVSGCYRPDHHFHCM